MNNPNDKAEVAVLTAEWATIAKLAVPDMTTNIMGDPVYINQDIRRSLQAIASGAHVVIPARELAAKDATIADLRAKLEVAEVEHDRTMKQRDVHGVKP